jgi:hypothetical protein
MDTDRRTTGRRPCCSPPSRRTTRTQPTVEGSAQRCLLMGGGQKAATWRQLTIARPERVTAHAPRLAARLSSVSPSRHVVVDGLVDEGGVSMSIAGSSAPVGVTELTPEEAAAAPVRTQSADGPQNAQNGQHRPTGTNDRCARQPPSSVTAHCAKPPLGRFCKARLLHVLPPAEPPRLRLAGTGRRMQQLPNRCRDVGLVPQVSCR